ncbi:protocadherin beta-15-like [Alligator sinensis]|uniref:Protocadherin gamma-C3 n=1 Tax=Alligator sinensis TaxID=38654 RepID=A0A3Q0FJB2_ALLSI|nr:protocadherin beta-15-like [Alligator sinensis]
MARWLRSSSIQRQVVFLIFSLCAFRVGCETIRYSVPEEMERDSFVANIAKDLGVTVSEMAARKARVITERSKQYFRLNLSTGDLTIREKLDREEICPHSEICKIFFEIFFDNPLQLIRAEVEIYDINDNSPLFPENEIILEIQETTSVGSGFPLESAQDIDVGSNSLQNYTLGLNDHFSLVVRAKKDGDKYAELVLQRQLDREEKPEMSLTLTATDGGSPPRSGTAQVRVIVLDANDNIPVFTRETYEAHLLENSPVDHLVVRVVAKDPDEGSSGEVRYSFTQKSERHHRLFQINSVTGEIRVVGRVDYEEAKMYEMGVRATDGGGLSAHCRVLVGVLDVNDNPPELVLTTLTRSITEDSPPQTVVALFSVRDRDSGDNGRTVCSIPDDVPFILTPARSNYYELRTETTLDRERISEYNITITTMDMGTPSLTAQETISLEISDVNDNTPEFTQRAYSMSVRENNSPELLIGSVTALDTDAGQNARVTYSILRGPGVAASSVSINPESGDIYVLRATDYEEEREFEVGVRATDAGSPALSSEAVLRVVVLDENDNAPFVLHPLQNSTAAWSELVPRSAEPGYLVTKVVAVDADAGQNAWLSYQLLRATEPGLFAVALHSGEVRTSRPLTERDTVKHRLIVLVRDSGESPLSSSATLNILLVDGFSDAYLQSADAAAAAAAEGADTGALTMYLTVSLCLVSFLFLLSVVTFVLLKVCRRRGGGEQYTSAPGTLYGDGNLPRDWVDVSGTGTLSRSYRYEVCLSTGSGSSEFRFLRPLVPCPPQQGGCVVTGSGKERDLLTDSHAPTDLEGADQGTASFSEDLVPRSGGPGCAVNKLIGSNEDSGQNGLLSYQ